MTAGVGTSMPYSGITSTLPKEGEMGFPDMGGRSVIALKSLSSPRPPREKEPRKRSWFAPLSKERLRVNASNEGNARRLIKIYSASAAEDPLARHCLNASSA